MSPSFIFWQITQIKKTLLLTVAGLMISVFSYGQGTVRGKIADKNGESLIGVVVKLQSNPAGGKTTDLDGNFAIKLNDSTVQTLIITYIGFDTIKETVRALNNEVVIKDFTLNETSHELKEVQIVAKATKAKDYYMENVKKNSSTTIDYISAETMKKTGDPNVNAAVARVSGVATNNSGFITVRGIGDRYVLTTMNGLRIPTLDPLTNNVRLDMFPAYLVDNVIITKTASPNLPGNWAGAYVSVETKDYPDKLSIVVEDYFGYNNQTSFKNIMSSEHSSTDWLGYDNSFRERNTNNFSTPNFTPSPYQEMVQLGLGSYYKSMGVTGWSDATSGTPGDAYYKLGLVQLGLLSKADFNNATAVKKAEDTFTDPKGPYYTQAYNGINAGAVKAAQSFPNNWNTTTKAAPLNFSQNFSIGNQVKLFGRPLGFLTGFRYSSTNQFDPNSIANRARDQSGALTQYINQQQVAIETRGWSALFNVAYKFNSNNSVALMFMPNVTGVNNVRNNYDTINTLHTITQFYESRKQMIYQYKSEHYIPWKKIKIDLHASYTRGQSNAPDFKVLQYQLSPGTNTIDMDPTNNFTDRYFRKLSDNLFDSRFSAEIPLGNKIALPRKLMAGGGYFNDQQRNDQLDYKLGKHGDPPATSNLSDYLSLNNFAISNNNINLYYYDNDASSGYINHTFGRSYITSAFAMLDYSIVSRLRVSGGLRVEKAYIYTDIDRFDSLNYSWNDPRRAYGSMSILANPGKLDATSYLPSANIIYKIKKSEDAPINLRLNYSQSVARPSIRELSPITQYNYLYQANILGNPDLKMAHITNYDVRLESYFKNGDNVSVSVFYKDFKDHIELVYSDFLSWQNVAKSSAKGIEIEGKKKIIKHLDLMANITFVNSQETFVRSTIDVATSPRTYTPIDTVKRVMYGQAPYIINGILSYTADSIGLVMALSYNVQGPRLVIAQNTSSIPDVYELARHLLDLRITKKFGKHFSANITINNILNAPIRRAYKYVHNSYSKPTDPVGFVLAYDTYTYGTNYTLGIIYKL